MLTLVNCHALYILCFTCLKCSCSDLAKRLGPASATTKSCKVMSAQHQPCICRPSQLLLTRRGAVLVDPHAAPVLGERELYASAEELLHQAPTTKSDVYSLGVLLLELLHPLKGEEERFRSADCIASALDWGQQVCVALCMIYFVTEAGRALLGWEGNVALKWHRVLLCYPAMWHCVLLCHPAGLYASPEHSLTLCNPLPELCHVQLPVDNTSTPARILLHEAHLARKVPHCYISLTTCHVAAGILTNCSAGDAGC